MVKRKLIALSLGSLLALASVTSAFAAQPPGKQGYEGQPGNYSQQHGHAPGLRGYEGQPGHQAGSR